MITDEKLKELNRDAGGTCDVYLSVADVKRLSKAFDKIAKLMKKLEEKP